jgi:hypothetical protein
VRAFTINQTSDVSNQALPWYRYGWPWFLISFPLISILLGFVMLYLALQTNNSLVVDDYYKQGKAINQRIERDKNASLLGLSARISPSNEGLIVELSQQAPSALPPGLQAQASELQQQFSLPEVIDIRWVHITQAEHDGAVSALAIGGGRYIAANTELPDVGKFRVHVQPEPELSWRLVGSLQDFSMEKAFRLDAPLVDRVFNSTQVK